MRLRTRALSRRALAAFTLAFAFAFTAFARALAATTALEAATLLFHVSSYTFLRRRISMGDMSPMPFTGKYGRSSMRLSPVDESVVAGEVSRAGAEMVVVALESIPLSIVSDGPDPCSRSTDLDCPVSVPGGEGDWRHIGLLSLEPGGDAGRSTLGIAFRTTCAYAALFSASFDGCGKDEDCLVGNIARVMEER